MGLFDKLAGAAKSVGRAIDPTSSKAPLGAYVKQGIVAVTGQAGAGALDLASQAGAAARAGSPTVPTTQGGPLPASPGSPVAAAPWWRSPVVLGLAAVVIAAVSFLAFRKR